MVITYGAEGEKRTKMDISEMELTDVLGQAFHCDCGRTHEVKLGTVEISAGALEKIGSMLRKDEFKRPFVVSDHNTYRVAGSKLLSLLSEKDISYSSHVFQDGELIPDERAAGSLLMNMHPDTDLIIAVGTGTIIDLCRFVSYRLKIPYYIVATAPSTDGLASKGAALLKSNYKTTFNCEMPQAIIADVNILATAPKNMIIAGYSDLIGKYTCLADWQLSRIINNEYYCAKVVELAKHSLEKAIAVRKGIDVGKPEAIAELMEALVLSGIAMGYAGSSRPSAGSEHHLSHFWEVRFQFENKPSILHGIKVGIATVLIAELYKYLRQEELDPGIIANINPPALDNWENEIKEMYRDGAQEVILLEQKSQKNNIEQHKQRIRVIAERWEEIVEVLNAVPDPGQIAKLLADVGGFTAPSEVGLDQTLVYEALLYAKEIRARYTILQLLWDLNFLKTYADMLIFKE